MRNLRLVGLSSDGRQVVYVDDTGVEFHAPADDRLRAAMRGDRARLGQLEIEMDSALRPRDIQARIRAGEAPDSVAARAGVPVDRIMPYCVPVLAERRHVADTAGRCHVRRANADGQSRRLGEVIAERLRSRQVDPESADWDAWRRDDGRWTIRLDYHSGDTARSAHFVFDQAGRYSLADDDEARWLTGERQSTVHGPQPREHSEPSAGRRLAVVAADDDLLSLAPDDLGVAESLDYFAETSDDLTAVVRAVREASAPATATPTATATATADDDPASGGDDATDEAGGADDQAVETGSDDAEPAAAEASADGADQPPRPQRSRRSGRASVPSWDEIMLGRAEK
jgi:Protein of unknown function (DUF3071)